METDNFSMEVPKTLTNADIAVRLIHTSFDFLSPKVAFGKVFLLFYTNLNTPFIKTTASQNEVVLSYHRVYGLYFVVVII